jgi:uncharacterized membrane protein YphA (DoxX/SURF4 family)
VGDFELPGQKTSGTKEIDLLIEFLSMSRFGSLAAVPYSLISASPLHQNPVSGAAPPYTRGSRGRQRAGITFVFMSLLSLAQVGSGLAILSGALIRLGAACIIAVMLGAIFFVHFFVHLPQGFDVGDVGVSMLQRRIEGGAEYALMQLLVAIALLITGAGAYSLTPRLPKPLRKL